MNKIISKKSLVNIAGPFALAIFFLLDRFLKDLALKEASFKILGDFFQFNFVPNYYIAFSLPLSGAWLTFFISLVITALVIYFLTHHKRLSRLEIIAFLAIIMGAISNLTDRLNYGFVIDYFDLYLFTVFNLADVLISFGFIILLLRLLKKES